MSESAPPPPPNEPEDGSGAPPPPPEYGDAASTEPAGPPPGYQPSAGPPAGPPPGYEPPPGDTASGLSGDQMMSAVQSAHKFDLGLIVGGLLVFLFSLLPYYTFSAEVKGAGALADSLGNISRSDSVTAWHGFFGWFAALVAVGVAVVVLLKVLGVLDAALANLLALIGVAVAGLCVILALFIYPDGGSDIEGSVDLGGGVSVDVSTGHGIGYWLTVLVIIAMAAIATLRHQDKSA
jgi:hypothetical protein